MRSPMRRAPYVLACSVVLRDVGGHVAEQETSAAAEAGGAVVGVVERAAAQRQAAAPDALGELVAQADEGLDLRVESGTPGARDAVPVGLVRGAFARQRRQRVADLRQAEAHGLRGADERQPPEHVTVVAPLGAVRARRADEPLAFVEPQR